MSTIWQQLVQDYVAQTETVCHQRPRLAVLLVVISMTKSASLGTTNEGFNPVYRMQMRNPTSHW